MEQPLIVERTTDDIIDELEYRMRDCKPMVSPVKDYFIKGMYIREIYMPKGTEGEDHLITSLIHKTTHPFFVLQGKVSVFSENDGEQLIEAPHWGMTTPGTRRVLLIHEDCIWITCHPTSIQPADNSPEAVAEAVRLIGEEIIEQRDNVLLGGIVRNNIFLQRKLDLDNIK